MDGIFENYHSNDRLAQAESNINSLQILAEDRGINRFRVDAKLDKIVTNAFALFDQDKNGFITRIEWMHSDPKNLSQRVLWRMVGRAFEHSRDPDKLSSSAFANYLRSDFGNRQTDAPSSKQERI